MTSFEEFAIKHERLSRNDGTGWLEPCFTIDGRRRLTHAIRAPNEVSIRLGQSVNIGADGRMSGDIRRWPQNLLDARTNIDALSATARAQTERRISREADDRLVTHARGSEDSNEIAVYKKLAPGVVLRWRLERDRRHAQVQLCRPITNASDMRRHLVEANMTGLIESRFPDEKKPLYLLDFMPANDIDFETIRPALQVRPGIIRLPLLKAPNKEDAAQERWNSTLLAGTGGPFSLAENVVAEWCAFHDMRVARAVPTEGKRRVMKLVSLTAGDEVIAHVDGGETFRWSAKELLPNTDVMSPTSTSSIRCANQLRFNKNSCLQLQS